MFCILSGLSEAGLLSWPPAVLIGPPGPTLEYQTKRNDAKKRLLKQSKHAATVYYVTKLA